MYVCMPMCAHVYVCASVHVCVQECMCTYIHMYIYFLHLLLVPLRGFIKHHLLCEIPIKTTTH